MLIHNIGLLDRDEETRNKIEQLTLAVLTHLPSPLILFVTDPSEHCGYPLANQLQLRRRIKALYPGLPWIDVRSKQDLVGEYKDNLGICIETESSDDGNTDIAPEMEAKAERETGTRTGLGGTGVETKGLIGATSERHIRSDSAATQDSGDSVGDVDFESAWKHAPFLSTKTGYGMPALHKALATAMWTHTASSVSSSPSSVSASLPASTTTSSQTGK